MSDPRLLNWVEYMNRELPKARIKIVTNGDFLNEERYKQYRQAGVDVFYISQHGEQLHRKCRTLLEKLSAKEKDDHIVFQNFLQDYNDDQKMFTNRGGDVVLNKSEEK